MYRLRVVPVAGDPFEHVLETDSLIIGRADDADLVLADPALSRRHARLRRRGEGLFVEDLESRNGTLLNGTTIGKPTPVRPGDMIRLCGSVIEVGKARDVLTSPRAVADMPILPGASSRFSPSGETLLRSASELLAASQWTAGERPEALQQSLERLQLLTDIHRDLARPIDLEELLALILDRLFDHLKPEQGAVFLKQPDGGYRRAASRSVDGDHEDVSISRRLTKEVAEKGQAALVLDARTDQRFAAAESLLDAGVRSLLAAPLLDAEGSLGMIVLHSRATVRRFSEDDLELLVSLAAVAALRIRNVTLAQESAESHRNHALELASLNDELQRERDYLRRALGKLAAGLAHELNNPAAALCRAASDLKERIATLPRLLTRVSEQAIPPEQLGLAEAAWLSASRKEATSSSRCEGSLVLGELERCDREDQLADWLTERGLEEGWMLAETLVEAGLGPDELATVVGQSDEATAGAIVAWMEASLAAARRVVEISTAAGRISELIGSIKEHSHLDRAHDLQPTDIHQGLESTLVMLAHKLKKKSLHIVRDFQDDLPSIPAHPAELNQVWTNLIDNAVDAMSEAGELCIKTRYRGQQVVTEITDDGGGIPPELQARIFEPFFTTKDTGEGTGLGLDITRRIVTQQHHGEVSVESQPGRTTFTVALPLRRRSNTAPDA